MAIVVRPGDKLVVIDPLRSNGYFKLGQEVVCAEVSSDPTIVTLEGHGLKGFTVDQFKHKEFLKHLRDFHPKEDAFDLPILVPEPLAPAPSILKNKKLDTQVGGDHYRDFKIQPLEYILANDIRFTEGSVIKYVSRWDKKNGVQDLRKAIQNLEVLIEDALAKGWPDDAAFAKGTK